MLDKRTEKQLEVYTTALFSDDVESFKTAYSTLSSLIPLKAAMKDAIHLSAYQIIDYLLLCGYDKDGDLQELSFVINGSVMQLAFCSLACTNYGFRVLGEKTDKDIENLPPFAFDLLIDDTEKRLVFLVNGLQKYLSKKIQRVLISSSIRSGALGIARALLPINALDRGELEEYKKCAEDVLSVGDESVVPQQIASLIDYLNSRIAIKC